MHNKRTGKRDTGGKIGWLRRGFVDATYPNSLAAKARAKRNALLIKRFPNLTEMRVVDLGGRPAYWRTFREHPAEVVLVNLEESASQPEEEWMKIVYGDACDPPKSIVCERFDLAFSNSTIEHVGGHRRREDFSRTVKTLGDAYWVQTPYRYFPVEPHWMFPGFQFLPLAAKRTIGRLWPPAEINFGDGAGDLGNILQIELLSVGELRHYFPGAVILRERFAGLTKSIIAVSGYLTEERPVRS